MRVPTISRLRPACLVALGLTLAVAAACKKQNAYVPPPPPQVGVAKPLHQKVMPYLESTGNAVAYNQVDLEARVQGFLQEIDYKDGAAAKQGDTLFVIEPAPYQAQLQQAQATLAATQADLIQAQAEYTRQSTLGKSDFASQSVVDQARAKLDADKAKILNDQAGVTIAAINLGYTRVTAPFDGMVTAHLVSVGGLVGVSGPTKLATIVQLDPIYVTFNVSEQDVLRVKAMMAAARPDTGRRRQDPGRGRADERERLSARRHDRLHRADLDPSTGTLQVRGVFENAERCPAARHVRAHARAVGRLARPRRCWCRTGARRRPGGQLPAGGGQGQRGAAAHGADRPARWAAAGDHLRLTADDVVVVSGNQRAIPGEKVAPQTTTITAHASTASPAQASPDR